MKLITHVVTLMSAAIALSQAVMTADLAAAPQYRATILDLHGSAINESGTVVGTVETEKGARAAIFEHGKLTVLDLVGEGVSEARAVNDIGTVVGVVKMADPSILQGFIYRDGVMELMEPMPALDVVPEAVNNHDEVVGYLKGEDFCAFHWKDGQFTNLGTLTGNGFSFATAISDDGTIIGNARAPGHEWNHWDYGFIWREGVMEHLSLGDGLDSAANGMNKLGQIAGGVEFRPEIWDNVILSPDESITQMGSLAGYPWTTATRVNNRLQALGLLIFGMEQSRAAYWQDGQWRRLDEMIVEPAGDYELRYVMGINNTGQILTQGRLNGVWHSFLLEPIEPADFDGNGAVDAIDLGRLILQWGGQGISDINGDGIVDGVDLGLLLLAWSTP